MSLSPSDSSTRQVLIVGAGLTGLTTAFRLKCAGIDVGILETADRVGGQIHSFHRDGFIYESGPNTGALSHPEVAEPSLRSAPSSPPARRPNPAGFGRATASTRSLRACSRG